MKLKNVIFAAFAILVFLTPSYSDIKYTPLKKSSNNKSVIQGSLYNNSYDRNSSKEDEEAPQAYGASRSRRVDSNTVFKRAFKSRQNNDDATDEDFSEMDFFFTQTDGDVQDLRKGIFLSSSKDGSQASAFYLKMKGKNFIVTGSKLKGGKVVTSFYGVDGKIIHSPKSGYLVEGKDIIMMPTKDIKLDSFAFDSGQSLNSWVQIGDEILVIGNHGSSGFLKLKKGKITAMGPSSLETSIKSFDFGSIGSPVLHKKSGVCIGVVAFVIEEVRSRGNIKRYQMVNLEDDVLLDSGRFYIMRLDIPLKFNQVSFAQLEKMTNNVNESSLSVEYIKEYVINQCFRNELCGFMCTIDESPLKEHEGLFELKTIIKNHNQKIIEIKMRSRYHVDARGQIIWGKGVRLIWQQIAEETLKDLKKYLYQKDADLGSTKAKFVMPFDANPLSIELRALQKDIVAIINVIQRQTN